MNSLTYDFTQTPLYRTITNFVRDGNALVSKLEPEGRRLFARAIRQELVAMARSMFRAMATKSLKQRMVIIGNTGVHFYTVCGLFTTCYDLEYLPEADLSSGMWKRS